MFAGVWVSYPLKQGLKQKKMTHDVIIMLSLSQLSIKTRIETLPWGSNMPCPRVWVSYPLKQGLKQRLQYLLEKSGSCLSQLSIKTRIETRSEPKRNWPGLCLSQLSIKTRIETWWCLWLSGISCCLSQLSIKTRIETAAEVMWERRDGIVWVSYPLKQGLKLLNVWWWLPQAMCLSQLSIKTRIETRHRLHVACDLQVWVSYPLKQGLKRFIGLRADENAYRFESAIH